jgi:hypothetical protein
VVWLLAILGSGASSGDDLQGEERAGGEGKALRWTRPRRAGGAMASWWRADSPGGGSARSILGGGGVAGAQEEEGQGRGKARRGLVAAHKHRDTRGRVGGGR